MREVLRRLTQALDEGRERILCQVVETKGSTPQKAGALMIVDPDGGQIGTLGGGCVENEVKMKAARCLGKTGATVESFILDHDYAWADGLICGGKMVILTEAIRGPESAGYFKALLGALEKSAGFTETIVVDAEKSGIPRVGARVLFDPARNVLATHGIETAPLSLHGLIDPLTDRPKPSLKSGVAILPTLPRVRLVIVGAGHVGQSVAELAARADFDVCVVDDRAQYANRDRFPAAREIVVGPIEEVLKNLELNPNTYAVIVTRGHGHDQEALFHLAPTSASYVGLIGSKRKIKLIFESLKEQGVSAVSLARVAAPVGFDIGSQSVFEIGVSIVAELIARRNVGAAAVEGKVGSREGAA